MVSFFNCKTNLELFCIFKTTRVPANCKHVLFLTARSIRQALFFAVVSNLFSGNVAANDQSPHEFKFARMVYSTFAEWPRWRADWPEAETHFMRGVQRLTVVDAASDGVLLQLTDEKLFDYPWLYVVEVGFMSLSDRESEVLREYLLRGGFLLVDDFHGYYEWQQFQQTMRRVFPDRPIVDLDNGSPAFNVLYDLSERQQIPGIRSLMNNQTFEKGGRTPGWLGILDDQKRVMVAVVYNQDIGDAWEHADDVRYPQPYTAQAYRLGVNYVVYAMTH